VTTDNSAEILAQRDAEIAKINGYVDLTQEAKDRRKNEVRARAQVQYEEAKAAEKQQREERLASTKKDVLRIPTGMASFDAEEAQIHQVLHSFWREVVSATELSATEGIKGLLDPRQQQLEAEQKLEPILEQAERTDNELMSRAIYHRAIDLGAQSIVDRYLATSPVDAKNWRLYTEAAQEMQQAKSPENLLG